MALVLGHAGIGGHGPEKRAVSDASMRSKSFKQTRQNRLALSAGTSKWNKIEHRLFCHIIENWPGRPLRTLETMVELIGHTTMAAGLRVKAKLDQRRYPTGRVITRTQKRDLALRPH